ncbi:MAG: C4-type zinc ribbon domain-containing protein [Bdellovibrionota bacterium]|nr:MAG: C4-type zinc ribbon domain-containing protein [Bdellovibrionota bacterium]
MTAPQSSLLDKLITLSKLDSSIALALAEQKKLQSESERKSATVKQQETELAQRSKAIEERKLKTRREESSIKEEQDKLVARRKALATLNNYKLQQAGEREIEHNAKQLHAREDTLLKQIEELEKIQSSFEAATAQLSAARDELTKFQRESAESIAALEEKLLRHRGEREGLASQIEKTQLSLYNRIKSRYPSDAVVEVKQGSCSGCFVQVGSQTVVQILKGEAIARCPGCGRILFMKVEDPA